MFLYLHNESSNNLTKKSPRRFLLESRCCIKWN